MSSDEFKDSLQEIASRYHIGEILDDKIYDQMFHHELARRITNLLRPGIRVLELGYGEGTVSAETFSNFSTERHIVEGSADLAQKAAIDLGNLVKVHNCLFSEFLSEEKFDLVLATNVFEHVQDTSGLFKSIRNWLSADGVCIITVPNSESFHRRIAVEMGIQESTKTLSARDEIVGHLRVYDLAQIMDEVRRSGFKINRIEGMVLKFLSNSLQKKLPIEVISALHGVAHQYPAEYAANLYLEVVRA